MYTRGEKCLQFASGALHLYPVGVICMTLVQVALNKNAIDTLMVSIHFFIEQGNTGQPTSEKIIGLSRYFGRLCDF